MGKPKEKKENFPYESLFQFFLILKTFFFCCLALVIAIFNGENSEGVATRKAVEGIAQYLRDQGY